MTTNIPQPAEFPETDALLYAFRRNIVVAASAGTGKTYRLTALYVLLTLGLTSMGERNDRTAARPLGPHQVVATTFSRAAAQEIATRVEQALLDIAAWDGKAEVALHSVLRLRQEVLTPPVSPAELRARAAAALARWSSAKVDTLHGLARRIVERHGLQMGVPPTSRILDEDEALALSDVAVDDALSEALAAGGPATEAARGLIVSAGGVARLRRQIVRLIDRLDEEGLSPLDLACVDHARDCRAAMDRLRTVAEQVAMSGSERLRQKASSVVSLIESHDDSPAHIEVLTVGIQELFATRLPARGKRLPADDALDDFINTLPGPSKLARARGMMALLRNAAKLGAREPPMRALIEDVRLRLVAAKSKASAMGFGDLLRLSRKLLCESAEVSRAVREETLALLVDEFQDTSQIQRDLIYLLRETDEAASRRRPGTTPRAEDIKPHGLFLVGDRKQSIYGFRGADVAVFSRIAGELAGRAAAEALRLPQIAAFQREMADFIALRESRRSGARILNFVNCFSARDFAQHQDVATSPPVTSPRDFEVTYGSGDYLTAHAAWADAPGAVVFLEDSGASPTKADAIVTEASGAAREAHVAAAYIRHLVPTAATGTPGSPVRPTRYKDVALLARRRSSLPLVELALFRLSIPYIVAGRALYDAPEVRDMAALLRLLLDPRDRLALATVLRGPIVGLSDAALALLSVPGEGLSASILGPERREPSARANVKIDFAQLPMSDRGRLDAFRTRYADLRATLLRLPPDQALSAAMDAFDIDRVLAALPRADARIGNLNRLVSIARRQAGTLAGFVRWLDRHIRDEADEAEAAVFSAEDDAVRLTTIHASKGLSFPVVVLVDMNAQPRGDYPSLSFLAPSPIAPPTLVVRHYAPREDDAIPLQTVPLRTAQADALARNHAERRRLSYVAMTRAERLLVLVGAPGNPRPGSALRTLVEGLGQSELKALVRVEDACALLDEPANPVLGPKVEAPTAPLPAPRPSHSPSGAVTVPVGALAVYSGCPRRFQLRYVLGLDEPPAKGQANLFEVANVVHPIDGPPPLSADGHIDVVRRRFAAHRLLQRWPRADWGAPTDAQAVVACLAAEGFSTNNPSLRPLGRVLAGFLEGDYARRVFLDGGMLRTRERFVLTFGDELDSQDHLRAAVTLEAFVNLTVTWSDGAIDLLSLPASESSEHNLVLRVAAIAVRRASPAIVVRAALVTNEAEPVFLSDAELARAHDAAFSKSITRLVRRLADARFNDEFDGVGVQRCQRLACGFHSACHGGAGAQQSRAIRKPMVTKCHGLRPLASPR